MRYKNIGVFSTEEFRRLTGVKKTTFEKMVVILKEAEITKNKQGGKPNKLAMEDRLLMALEYIREYRTYFHVASSYGISESACYRNVKWIENTLIKHSDFALPGRKALVKSDVKYEVVLIDATESPIERPKKSKDTIYSGKKKRHTLKTQIVVDKVTHQVICTDFSNGKRHDFRLFKESKTHIHPETLAITDTGYQGLQKLHGRSELPKKRSKKYHLTKADKQNNRRLSSERVLNENVIGMLKRFKIIADKYRNRRKRFGLRFNLIAGLYNWELKH